MVDNKKNQGLGLDKTEVIDYIVSETEKRLCKDRHDFHLIYKAFCEKKNVRIEIETTFGQISNIVVWIKEKRGLYRKLSL